MTELVASGPEPLSTHFGLEVGGSYTNAHRCVANNSYGGMGWVVLLGYARIFDSSYG